MSSPCDGCTGLKLEPDYEQCYGCSRAWNSGLAKAVRGPDKLEDKYIKENLGRCMWEVTEEKCGKCEYYSKEKVKCEA